jgi:FSR family fosmidomycin resistance protein-like MFS transporter
VDGYGNILAPLLPLRITEMNLSVTAAGTLQMCFVAVLSLGGFLLQSPRSVNVTFGQMIAPISAATVSLLMMGFAWGTGGLAVPLVGMGADRIGIERTLVTMSVVPLVAAARSLPLPAGKHADGARPSAVSTAEATGTDVAQ